MVEHENTTKKVQNECHENPEQRSRETEWVVFLAGNLKKIKR